MTNQNDLSARTLTLKRTFDAPIQLVWDAWTNPLHLAAWWGPKGMETKVVAHDFREGGSWKYIMAMPNGGDFISEGVYSEIVEREKIVSTADFKPMTEGVIISASFVAAGDKTEFTFRVIHATEEYKQQQEQMGFEKGWGSTFERLGELVASL